MKGGVQERLERLFNRRGDERAVCVAADHGYMSDVTPNVVKLRPISEAVMRRGGWHFNEPRTSDPPGRALQRAERTSINCASRLDEHAAIGIGQRDQRGTAEAAD